MKRYFRTLLHHFYPAGIEESISNIQPYYSAGDIPAKEKNQMIKKLVLTALIVLITLTLAACAPRLKTATTTILSAEEGAAYAAEVDEIVENLLVGWSTCDFTMATRDFDEVWEGFFKKTPFPQLCNEYFGTYGAYLSKTLDHVEDQPGFRRVIYHAVFKNIPDLTVNVDFVINDTDRLINGFGWSDE